MFGDGVRSVLLDGDVEVNIGFCGWCWMFGGRSVRWGGVEVWFCI